MTEEFKKINTIDYIAIDGVAAKEIQNANCITGDNNHLIHSLKEAFKKAKSIDIIVAFLMESGVKLLEEDLREAVKRNIPVRILTGNYLNITQPHALYKLRDIMGDKVDLRFYNVPNKSFHPKAYIFEFEEGGELYVGSSNISRSALTYGIEWNYRLDKNLSPVDFNHFKNVFEDLFLNKSIIIDENEMRRYSQNWVRPKVYKDLKVDEESEVEDLQPLSKEVPEDNNLLPAAKDELQGNNIQTAPTGEALVNPGQISFKEGPENNKQLTSKEEGKLVKLYEPRGAQIEALYELKKTREEGADKGLVVAATGIGKTYLAAFDSISFERILFVAHREEILKQAQQSFKNVRPDKSTGLFFGDTKEGDKDIVFATVQTLGKEEYLNEQYFAQDYFDYIVIDGAVIIGLN